MLDKDKVRVPNKCFARFLLLESVVTQLSSRWVA